MKNAVFGVLCLLISVTACKAATLRVHVVSQDGLNVPDAVVTLFPKDTAQRKAMPPGPFTMTQKDVMFHPFVLIVSKGGEVEFPNMDKVRHHVYSFSKGNRFELKLYGREEHRSVVMKNPGTVALGCNIHDEMVAFIRVVETGFAAKTDAMGNAQIVDVPAGVVSMHVWHPYTRETDQEVISDLTVDGDASLSETVTLDMQPPEGYALSP